MADFPPPHDPRLEALRTIACSVAPGPSGLGRGFEGFISWAEAHGIQSVERIFPDPDHSHAADGHVHDVRPLLGGGRFLLWTPLRYSYAWITYAAGVSFDLAVARSLGQAEGGFTGYAGQSLASLRRARALGRTPLALISPTTHVDHALAQHRLARSQYPIDHGWLNQALRKRTRLEYELADVILLHSEFQRETFVAHGVAPEKLLVVPLPVIDPRFQAPRPGRTTHTFNIVYVGRFDLPKGIPVLLEAFLAAAEPDWRLTLRGAFCTRSIRRYMLARTGTDPRISILEEGDAWATLETADVFVHPSYDDGYGYAPLEALAMSIPVIVTDMTGMKDQVTEGVNGSVVPAGDVSALADALRLHAAARSSDSAAGQS